MALVSDQDRARIKAAVETVEAATTGEFVIVIAKQADEYLFIPILWAALLALALPGVLHFSAIDWAISYSYPIQISAFVIAAVLFRWPPLMMRLIPKAVKKQRAHRMAQQQFLAQNLHHTRDRTGILLFVCEAEHHVEIIADQGINDRVAAGTWDRTIETLVTHIKTGRVVDGLIGAVESCGQQLQTHFPHRADEADHNELPDHLVEI